MSLLGLKKAEVKQTEVVPCQSCPSSINNGTAKSRSQLTFLSAPPRTQQETPDTATTFLTHSKSTPEDENNIC